MRSFKKFVGGLGVLVGAPIVVATGLVALSGDVSSADVAVQADIAKHIAVTKQSKTQVQITSACEENGVTTLSFVLSTKENGIRTIKMDTGKATLSIYDIAGRSHGGSWVFLGGIRSEFVASGGENHLRFYGNATDELHPHSATDVGYKWTKFIISEGDGTSVAVPVSFRCKTQNALPTSPVAQAVLVNDNGTPVITVKADKAILYPTCKALNVKYPHGVGIKGVRNKVKSGSKVVNGKTIRYTVNDVVYRKNFKLDADRDGIACER